jgi:hypothetical protein
MNRQNNQTWFEGEAEYIASFFPGGFKIGKDFKIRECYKSGNVASRITKNPLGIGTIIFKHEEQKYYSKTSITEVEIENVSNLPPAKVEEIDRNIVEINGHQCIKIVHSTTNKDCEIKSAHWVDESYNIPFLEGRIAEVPRGLVVKCEESTKTLKINFLHKKELKEVIEKEIQDSEFEL